MWEVWYSVCMLQRVDASAKQWSATRMVKAGQRVKAFGSEIEYT